jgi:4-amino-4-deoxy-L-arabinose transferase-like glycosyltransferase
MGVASVGVLSARVRRRSGVLAALIAGAVLATTPVAVLMFLFNVPEAVLVLLLVIGAYSTVCAIESGRAWWLAAAGSLVGLALLTKMLRALLWCRHSPSLIWAAAPVSETFASEIVDGVTLYDLTQPG